MSAPDRPTREQVEEALGYADSFEEFPGLTVLAAEVRALRAELDAAVREHNRHAAEVERLHDCLRQESDAHVAERDRLRAELELFALHPASNTVKRLLEREDECQRLRAALVARTPQPAEHEIDERFAYLATLEPNWDSYGAERIDPAVIATARSVLSALAAPAHICGTVNGGIQLAWDDEFVTIDVNPGDRLSASVGEMYADPESAPLPAVPDGEDVAVRRRWAAWLVECAAQADDLTEREAQGMRIAATHLLDDEIAARADRIDGLDGEWLAAFTERLHDRIEAHRFAVQTVRAAAAIGEDVPARLAAAADVLAEISGAAAGDFRHAANVLAGASPELRAAVAAALALPTEPKR